MIKDASHSFFLFIKIKSTFSAFKYCKNTNVSTIWLIKSMKTDIQGVFTYRTEQKPSCQG